MRSRRTAVVLTVAALGAAALAGVVLARSSLTIIGGARSEVLKGTAGPDRIYGKAGNDRLFGLGGNDLLVGGLGADTITCGAGRDTAVVDAKDLVKGDCEIVKRATPTPVKPKPPKPPAPPPPPPSPPPPPPPPAQSGHFDGRTSQSTTFSFDSTGASVGNFAVQYNGSCIPASVVSLSGTLPFAGPYPVSGGAFTFTSSGIMVLAGTSGAQYTATITGRLNPDGTANGTYKIDVQFTYENNPYQCSTGMSTWDARRS